MDGWLPGLVNQRTCLIMADFARTARVTFFPRELVATQASNQVAKVVTKAIRPRAIIDLGVQ